MSSGPYSNRPYGDAGSGRYVVDASTGLGVVTFTANSSSLSGFTVMRGDAQVSTAFSGISQAMVRTFGATSASLQVIGVATSPSGISATLGAGKVVFSGTATGDSGVFFGDIIFEPYSGYANYLTMRAPGWLQVGDGGRWQAGNGDSLDLMVDRFRQAVLARFIQRAPSDGLDLLGADRNMPRYLRESDAAYRARLQDAWAYWQWGGTKKGVQDVLTRLGYLVTVQEIYQLDTSRWAEFYVTIAPALERPSKAWRDGGTWGDGGKWGQGWVAFPDEREALEGVVADIKGAHTRLARFEWISQPTYPKWGDGGLWNDGGLYPVMEVFTYA